MMFGRYLLSINNYATLQWRKSQTIDPFGNSTIALAYKANMRNEMYDDDIALNRLMN